MRPTVSVLMPTYGQAGFLPRAVASLQAGSYEDWELVVIDDGSPDATREAASPFLADARVTYHRLAENRGLGGALNVALERSSAPLVAYLPSDDVLLRDHLAVLVELMRPGVVLAHTACAPSAPALQLVQVVHRRTADRWVEREELETDDLETLFWRAVRARGEVASTAQVTCQWTQHPGQRHRAMRESLDGGLNVFRSRYGVSRPLRFQPSDGALTDEPARYGRWRAHRPVRGPDGLRILMAGELAFNPDRVLAFEERGHELLGLWIDDPLHFNTVGPLPFGHVRDVPRAGWREAVEAARPDVIYALLNWRAVPLAHEVLDARLEIPLVFHFKEAPQRSIARGEWPLLADVVQRADACVFCSDEERDWFHAALPGLDPARTYVIDGDLPKREWLDGSRSRRLSEGDGEVHTVVVGRPYGWTDELRAGLAARGVRVHAHGGRGSIPPEDWVGTLSRYDAGWLHPVTASNAGDIRAATWDDLNVPARLPTLLAGGLPVILPRNSPGAVHASERVCSALGVAVTYSDPDELAATLRDQPALERLRRQAWDVRYELSFDRHVDRLLGVMRACLR